MKFGPRRLSTLATRPGDDVGQLARHRVLGDRRAVAVARPACQLREDGARARRRAAGWNSASTRSAWRVLGERDAQRGQVVQLAAHRRAEDDAGALGVERPLGIAVVGQRLGGDGDRPLLALVHRGRDARRDAEALPVELEAAHPAADLAVGLVRRGGIGVVVVGDAPALRRDFGDAVALVAQCSPRTPARSAHRAGSRPRRRWRPLGLLSGSIDHLLDIVTVGNCESHRSARGIRSPLRSRPGTPRSACRATKSMSSIRPACAA